MLALTLISHRQLDTTNGQALPPSQRRVPSHLRVPYFQLADHSLLHCEVDCARRCRGTRSTSHSNGVGSRRGAGIAVATATAYQKPSQVKLNPRRSPRRIPRGLRELAASASRQQLAIDGFRDRHFAARLRSGQIYSRSTAHGQYWHSRLLLYCMGVSLTVVHKVSFPALDFIGLFAVQIAASAAVYND